MSLQFCLLEVLEDLRILRAETGSPKIRLIITLFQIYQS